MITVYQGHVLKWLKMLPAGLFHVVITSPPYWNLRSYPGYPLEWPACTFRPMAGLAEVTVAGCVDGCAHEWGNKQIIKTGNNPSNRSTLYSPGELNPGHAAQNYGKQTVQTVSQGQFCRLCGGWRGSLGLEPTPLMFISHLVSIFREVHRVLRDDGTLWLNLSTSHAKRDIGNFKRKDLIPIPWMVAQALQADGWYLRIDGIWAKGLSFATHTTTCGHCGKKHTARYSGSCMPESTKDRPTKSHEYVFLLSKSPRYYFDQDAIREPVEEASKNRAQYGWNGTMIFDEDGREWRSQPDPVDQMGNRWVPSGGRNVRSVWAIDDTLVELVKFGLSQGMNIEPLVNAYLAAQGEVKSVFVVNPASFPGSHFATFSPDLVAPMIKASTSERGVCPNPACGAPWERVTEKEFIPQPDIKDPAKLDKAGTKGLDCSSGWAGTPKGSNKVTTIGWRPTCQCNAGEPIPATVADIFAGAMTTNLVADRLGRDSVAFELSEEYVTMGVDRCFQDAPLFTKIEVKK